MTAPSSTEQEAAPRWNPRTDDWGLPRVAGEGGAVKLGQVWGVETVLVTEALGRVAAADVVGRIPVPRWPLSEVEGLAVISSDTLEASPQQPIQFQDGYGVRNPWSAVQPGQLRNVDANALLSPGADAVISRLSSAFEGERAAQKVAMRVVQPIEPGDHVIPVGADVPSQHRFLSRGDRVTAATMAALETAGVLHIDVFRRLRIAVVTYGGTYQPPGHTDTTGWLPDAVGPLARNLMTQWGATVDVVERQPANDHMAVHRSTIAKCRLYDLVLRVGVMSGWNMRDFSVGTQLGKIGGEQFIPDEADGGTAAFSNETGRYRPADITTIDIHPDPTCGTCGVVVTMKGLPLSVLTSMYLVVRPVLDALSGVGATQRDLIDEKFRLGSRSAPSLRPPGAPMPQQGVCWLNGVLTAPAPRDPERHGLQLARFDHSEPGRVGLHVLPSEEYRVSPLPHAEAMVAIEKGTGEMPAGTPVQFFLLD